MNLGDVNYYTHSSKTRCVFVDNKELPLISIDIWCKAGSSFEDVDKNNFHFENNVVVKISITAVHKHLWTTNSICPI